MVIYAPVSALVEITIETKTKGLSMSQVLRDARRYEEEKEKLISAKDRPAFHLSARVGWMNDPNGFSYYDGQYHMFYQYHPYDSHWGPMHWGHAVSEDLIHCSYLPAAMAPDRTYDRDGCYSGSALTLPDGRQMLMYTGRQLIYDENGIEQEVQTQCLAFGDGDNYVKYAKNPVITGKDLPEGGNPYAFRDPKLWVEQDGSYRVVIANQDPRHGGQMLLYRSEDGVHWDFVKALMKDDHHMGQMWECPDFFPLDGKQVLLASAQDMLPSGLEYHNGNGTFYFIGDYNWENSDFKPECNYAMDYGIDFYAPQTILTPDGRRVVIGWMQNWDTCNLHTKSTPWFGQMSIPRELSIRDGRIYQAPIRELEALRSDPVRYRDVLVEDTEISLKGVEGRLVDLTLEIEPVEGKELYRKFALRFAQNETFHTGVSFRPYESIVKIDRKFSGSRRAIIHQRRAAVNHDHGRIKLRLILDRFSAEIFVNDGEKVLTATLYTDMAADGISFMANGAAKIHVTQYTLKEM